MKEGKEPRGEARVEGWKSKNTAVALVGGREGINAKDFRNTIALPIRSVD
ncbi:MAG: hypothetical protein OXP71_12370 [Candidatus Poribacteria bacterium]|nr:hypothetical protein [Candidatus Poribacteria bacterium]